jgi:chemotaxis protein MotB
LTPVDKILFDSGSADIKKNGKAVLDRVAEILGTITDKQIRIEGHTDNVPIGPVLAIKFPTNWELSTARSTTVVRYLQEKGVDPRFLSATGYSEYRPVESNESDEGKAKNRRIEIVLIPLDEDRITSP